MNIKLNRQSLKKFLRTFVSSETIFNSGTTHVNITNDKTTILVNGKKIDPESKQGKAVMVRMDRKLKIIDGGMDKVSQALRDMANKL